MSCETLADIVVEALETGRAGAVRAAVDGHVADCGPCRERAGAIRAMAEGLDPPLPAPSAGFVGRVMAEIRGERRQVAGAYDRLPPLWQVLGALALFVALTAVVLATGVGDAWHTRALTGFLDQSMGFLGGLSQAIRSLWDAVAPGRGLPILIACTVVATVLNVAFVVGVLRRRRTVE